MISKRCLLRNMITRSLREQGAKSNSDASTYNWSLTRNENNSGYFSYLSGLSRVFRWQCCGRQFWLYARCNDCRSPQTRGEQYPGVRPPDICPWTSTSWWILANTSTGRLRFRKIEQPLEGGETPSEKKCKIWIIAIVWKQVSVHKRRTMKTAASPVLWYISIPCRHFCRTRTSRPATGWKACQSGWPSCCTPTPWKQPRMPSGSFVVKMVSSILE